MGRFKAVLEDILGVLEASWAVLDSSWGRLGGLLGRHEAIVEASRAWAVRRPKRNTCPHPSIT